MQPLLRSLTAWTAALSPVVTLIGLIQSRGWLAAVGAAFAGISVVALLYARHQRMRVEATSIEIEGISVDCLNAANARRRVSNRFFVQTVEQTISFIGSDVEMKWRYAGYGRASSVADFEFSVDASTSIPFSHLECHGFDLKVDPERRHPIQPLLVGPDGISKKLALPLLEPIRQRQPFDVLLSWRVPRAYSPGIGYFASTLSFDQDTVDHCVVKLIFNDSVPEWVRAYDCVGGNPPRLLRNLVPEPSEHKAAQYIDVGRNRPARSARVYLFQRNIGQ